MKWKSQDVFIVMVVMLNNKEPCRLKDIVDLIMDTGLGRDSLSIISQGNISTFADSKPE